MKDVRIALSVFKSIMDAPLENARRMIEFICEAEKNGAEMIVFPELSLTGYGIRGEVRPVQALGKDTHTAITLLQDAADSRRMVISAGFAESGGMLSPERYKGRTTQTAFLTQAVFVPGKTPALYRKLHLGPPETDRFAPGNAVTVVNALDSHFGIQLCYDAHFPELSTLMSVRGAEIIIIPHASPRKTPEDKLKSWLMHLTARAYDNSVFVLAVNQVGEYIKGMSFPGVALAVNPAGELMASYTGNTENLLYVDLQKQMLEDVRGHRMRYFLANRRDDLFHLPLSNEFPPG